MDYCDESCQEDCNVSENSEIENASFDVYAEEDADDLYQEALAIYRSEPDPAKDAKAVSNCKRAVKHRHTMAEWLLARFYRLGRGVEESPEECAQWMMRAAKHNENVAIHQLGLMYLEGYGVKKSDAFGVAYIKAAAQRGYGPSIEYLQIHHPDVFREISKR